MGDYIDNGNDCCEVVSSDNVSVQYNRESSVVVRASLDMILIYHNFVKKTILFQMFLSIFSMAGGFAIYYSEYGTEKQCALWPIASSMVTSIIPYTLFGMMPLNYQLLETEKCIEKGMLLNYLIEILLLFYILSNVCFVGY